MQKFREHSIEWTGELISRLWDYYSKTYPYNQVYFTKTLGKDILLKTQRIVGAIENKTILDYGCGPGFFVDHLSDMKIAPERYIGLDFSEDSVKNIHNKHNVSFATDSVFAQSLPSSIESHSIDICFLIEVIEHLNDKKLEQTLIEVRRVLKPGGHLVITTPNDEDLSASNNFCPECGCVYHKWQHERRLDKVILEKILTEYGYAAEHISELNFRSENVSLMEKIRHFKKKLLGNDNKNLFGVFVSP